MTYASSAGQGGRPGGWGVLERDAGIPSELADFMEQGVVSHLDTGEHLPDFAPREVLFHRQRSLSFAFDPSRGAAWWHACPAGSDVTGRPGNVFTHVVGRLQPDHHSRPISLVRSSSWMNPFGHREVAASRLNDFQAPENEQNAGTVLERAFADPVRTEALLAAVTFCFQEDRPLVLVGDTPAVIDALERLSWTTSGVVSSTIPFRTFDRARSMPSPGTPFCVVGIPPEDRVAALTHVAEGRTNALVLDLGWCPDEEAETYWQVDGQTWPVDRRWQDAFFRLSTLGTGVALQITELMDEICAQLSPTELLNPSWPLALALLRHFDEGHPDRDDLCAEWAQTRPWDDLRDPRLRELLRMDETLPAVSVLSPPVDDQQAATGPQSIVGLLVSQCPTAPPPTVVEALEALWAASMESSGDEVQRIQSAVQVALGLAIVATPVANEYEWSRKDEV
nr:hypothetical protein [Aeromicrobium duanguangcaii]